MKFTAKIRYLLPALAAGTALALLAGCPSQSDQQSSAPPPTAQAAAFNGVVFGGRQPIVGATVVAYEVSDFITTSPTQIGSAVTDANGQFNMNFSPTPPAGRVVYVTASGGNGGAGPNAAIGLMTVAGAYCTSGTTGCNFPATVNINELTTVASTSALKDYIRFVACTELIGNTQSGTCIEIRDMNDVSRMALTVNNLVNAATGRPSDFLADASQTAGAPLRATREKLDTIASDLAACVNAPGPSDAACTGLFAAVLNRPSDTLRAAWAIAAWPGVTARGRALYMLSPGSPVFAPVLAAAPATIVGGFWTVGGERYAFAVNQNSDNISAWRLGVRNGSLDNVVPGSPFAVSGDANGAAVDPSGRFFYVANAGSNTVSAYTIGAFGALAPVTGSPFAAGSVPNSVAVDPSGQYVYVANEVGNNVSAYTIGPDGALTEIANSPFATGSESYSVVVDPSGRFVYVTNSGDNTVSAYKIGAGGALTEISGSPFATGSVPLYASADPSGRFLYVPNLSGSSVSAYAIGTSGALTEIAGSPFAAGFSPGSIAVDPSGRFAYVENAGLDTVSAYTIAPDGALTEIAGSPFATGDGPYSVTVDPSGRFVYVTNNSGASVSAYLIGTDGALTTVPGSPFTAGNGAWAVVVDPSGRYVYDTDFNGVSAFAIGSDGAFTPIAGSPFATDTGPFAVAMDSAGRYVYVTNTFNTVSAFLIGDGGTLAPVTGSPFPTGDNPLSVAVDPSDRYLYVVNNTDDNLSAYTIGADGTLTPVTASSCGSTPDPMNCYATGDGPASVAVDSSGRYVYVANSNSDTVSGYAIGAGGALTAMAGSPFPAGISPRWVVVDPLGYVYVSNINGNDISGYAIGAGGALTAMVANSCGSGFPSNCFAAGTFPEGLAVDPNNGHLFAANSGGDNVSVYSIFAAGGSLFQDAGSPFAAGVVPKFLTVDPTGHYLYVTNLNSNNISAYLLYDSPLLTPLAGSPWIGEGQGLAEIVTGP